MSSQSTHASTSCYQSRSLAAFSKYLGINVLKGLMLQSKTHQLTQKHQHKFKKKTQQKTKHANMT